MWRNYRAFFCAHESGSLEALQTAQKISEWWLSIYNEMCTMLNANSPHMLRSLVKTNINSAETAFAFFVAQLFRKRFLCRMMNIKRYNISVYRSLLNFTKTHSRNEHNYRCRHSAKHNSAGAHRLVPNMISTIKGVVNHQQKEHFKIPNRTTFRECIPNDNANECDLLGRIRRTISTDAINYTFYGIIFSAHQTKFSAIHFSNWRLAANAFDCRYGTWQFVWKSENAMATSKSGFDTRKMWMVHISGESSPAFSHLNINIHICMYLLLIRIKIRDNISYYVAWIFIKRAWHFTRMCRYGGRVHG